MNITLKYFKKFSFCGSISLSSLNCAEPEIQTVDFDIFKGAGSKLTSDMSKLQTYETRDITTEHM